MLKWASRVGPGETGKYMSVVVITHVGEKASLGTVEGLILHQQAHRGRNTRRIHPEQQEAIDFTTEPQTDSYRGQIGGQSATSPQRTTPLPHTFTSVTGSPILADP